MYGSIASIDNCSSLCLFQYLHLLNENEQAALIYSLDGMKKDLNKIMADAEARNRFGAVHPVTLVPQPRGQSGAPRKVIDRAWLTWASQRRSTSDIARFLNVSRTLVQKHLLDYRLADPGEDPFIRTVDPLHPYTTMYDQVY